MPFSFLFFEDLPYKGKWFGASDAEVAERADRLRRQDSLPHAARQQQAGASLDADASAHEDEDD